MILCGNPLAQYLAHKDEIDAAMARALQKGWYILGEEVSTFEAEFASYVGVKHGVGVGSGTDALFLALKACGIGQGDEVITVAHTAVATVSTIEAAGATPVFVDIEPDYFTLDPDKLEPAITNRTKAIVPVHIYGQPANLEAIHEIARRHNLLLIEDCAQAHGARYKGARAGSFGAVACFSFYPTKNLGAFGDGGMLVTNSDELANRARLLREYGWAERYVSSIAGYNSRLDELQAAILRVKLSHLDTDNQARQALAGKYNTALKDCGIGIPKTRPDIEHAYHLYVIRSQQRNELQSFLRSKGVGALVHYPVPVHRQPAYLGRLPGSEKLPETERAAREILSLPIYPELTEEQLQKVVDEIHEFQGVCV